MRRDRPAGKWMWCTKVGSSKQSVPKSRQTWDVLALIIRIAFILYSQSQRNFQYAYYTSRSPSDIRACAASHLCSQTGAKKDWMRENDWGSCRKKGGRKSGKSCVVWHLISISSQRQLLEICLEGGIGFWSFEFDLPIIVKSDISAMGKMYPKKVYPKKRYYGYSKAPNRRQERLLSLSAIPETMTVRQHWAISRVRH